MPQIQIKSRAKLAGYLALAAAGLIATCVGLKGAISQVEIVSDQAISQDEAVESVGSVKAGPAKLKKVKLGEAPVGGMTEHGEFHVQHIRPCTPGRTDISGYGTLTKRAYLLFRADSACGLLDEGIYYNALAYTGQQKILNCFFKATGCPTANALYVGLATATPVQTTTLATVTELAVGSGYARAQVNTWTVSANASSNNTAQTPQLSWTASGTWTAVTSMFVSDQASGTAGTLLSYAAFSASRSLVSGDVLNVTYTLTQQ